jgi:hypothetical protein
VIPSVPVAECVVIEMISPVEPAFARKPVASTEATLADMGTAVMPSGKMTPAEVTAPEVSTAMPAAEVTMTAAEVTMTASAVTTAVTTATTAATVTTNTLAPRNVGSRDERAECNRNRQNPSEFRFHDVLPVNTSSETPTQKRLSCNIVALGKRLLLASTGHKRHDGASLQCPRNPRDG